MESVISSDQLMAIAPLVVLTAGALLMLMFEVFIDRDWRREILSATALLISSLLYLYNTDLYAAGQVMFSGHLSVDRFSQFFSLFVLFSALAAVILGARVLKEQGVEAPGEYHALLLFCVIGTIVFVSAAHFMTLFIGLEIMSMALYALCASAPGRPRSSEAALKYFLLGSFSSAFLLYGVALLYGMTGTMVISEMSSGLPAGNGYLPMFSFLMVAFGLVFKAGGVPFHFWMPDVYQGAPTPITSFMASAVKAAAFAVMLRVFSGVFSDISLLWAGMLACVAAATMIVGNLLALQQRSMKRMLAYSSIAHAGYMLVGVLALGKQAGGASAILFYLVAYAAMTFGAFAIVQVVSNTFSSQKNSDDVSRFQGLGSAQPVLAILMSLFLFAMAGLPPGLSGLVGKFFLFSAAVKADYVMLSVVGVVCSAISCYYYLRVIVAMYFMEPAPASGTTEGAVSLPLYAILIVCAVLVVLLGAFPSRLLDLSMLATQTL